MGILLVLGVVGMAGLAIALACRDVDRGRDSSKEPNFIDGPSGSEAGSFSDSAGGDSSGGDGGGGD